MFGGPLKKGNIETGTHTHTGHTRRIPCQGETTDRADISIRHRTQMIASKTPEADLEPVFLTALKMNQSC